jgi:hypothetical protein
MLKGLISFASYTTMNEGAIGELFIKWEQMGFFSYLLPFLLIFSLVFGILVKVKLFKDNKAVNAIIALAVGLMAVQFDMVSNFFSQIFPLMGVALAIILAFFILVGLFIDPDHPAMNWVLFGIGAIIFIVVLVQAAGSFGWSANWLQDNWVTILGAAIVIALVVAVIAGSSDPNRTKHIPKSVFSRDFLNN